MDGVALLHNPLHCEWHTAKSHKHMHARFMQFGCVSCCMHMKGPRHDLCYGPHQCRPSWQRCTMQLGITVESHLHQTPARSCYGAIRQQAGDTTPVASQCMPCTCNMPQTAHCKQCHASILHVKTRHCMCECICACCQTLTQSRTM